MMHSDALIIGAGPTGLVLALWLTKLGVKVRIIDKTAEPGTTSRALAVQARTLELYRQLNLADAIVEHGHKVPAVNLWVSCFGGSAGGGMSSNSIEGMCWTNAAGSPLLPGSPCCRGMPARRRSWSDSPSGVSISRAVPA